MALEAWLLGVTRVTPRRVEPCMDSVTLRTGPASPAIQSKLLAAGREQGQCISPPLQPLCPTLTAASLARRGGRGQGRLQVGRPRHARARVIYLPGAPLGQRATTLRTPRHLQLGLTSSDTLPPPPHLSPLV